MTPTLKKTCVPDGCKIIRKDRSENFKQKYGNHGRVAKLFKENMKVEQIWRLSKFCKESVEEKLRKASWWKLSYKNIVFYSSL